MIALDTNIFVYAHRTDATLHDRARELVERLGSQSAGWGLPWSVAHEFLAVMTRLRPRPMPVPLAFDALERLTSAPGCTVLAERESYLPTLRTLTLEGGVSGARIYDARIAATCLANGVRELWTVDRDFGRFPALRTRNPLVGEGS